MKPVHAEFFQRRKYTKEGGNKKNWKLWYKDYIEGDLEKALNTKKKTPYEKIMKQNMR